MKGTQPSVPEVVNMHQGAAIPPGYSELCNRMERAILEMFMFLMNT
jgi:hypothetical protein